MEKKSSERQFSWNDFYGANFAYVVAMYEKFLQDPDQVHPEMQSFFATQDNPQMLHAHLSHREPTSYAIHETLPQIEFKTNSVPLCDPTPSVATLSANIEMILAAKELMNEIRKYGHLSAQTHPFQSQQCMSLNELLQEANLSHEALRSIPATTLLPNVPHLNNGLQVIDHLQKTYCGTISYEFNHVTNKAEKLWLQNKVEAESGFSIHHDKKRLLLKRLIEVDRFEKFLHQTFVGQKRFSIEGLDTLVPLLDELISQSVKHGTNDIHIGMAHRGRLNVLAHVLGKPYELIFSEFQHAPNKELVPSEGSTGINYGWSGDVKYHLGLDSKITADNLTECRITLENNPSHLEFVGAVVEGVTRATQDNRNDAGFAIQDESLSMAVIIHGDAAFPGQGIVSETLNLSRLPGYKTGGTIHIIANNMIGFTTEATDSRSTTYASDLAKGFEIPIVHVNADDPEAVLAASQLALLYRKKFHKDFLIDLIGYRRFGHNEMDEPRGTNPLMYHHIDTHPTVSELYFQQLKKEQHITDEAYKTMETDVQAKLAAAFEKVPQKSAIEVSDIALPEVIERGFPAVDTTVSLEELQTFNEQLLTWPTSFTPLKKLARILQRRQSAFINGGKIDWAHAEILAFASILRDETAIRFTGQDTERGTFAHRHLMLHDVNTGEKYCPLHHFSGANAAFTIYNSPLSEMAVLGFEYGYQSIAEDTLVIWEAQYGDFANSAQVMFDQFIAAGRAKWGKKSGLVVLLPHGYEGQGPEHSSGRPERFLQLAAENNWTVANLSTAAQYFHLLRRQAAILQKEEVRPLILLTPKSLLRNPIVSVNPEQLTDGQFQPVMEEPLTATHPKTVERLIFATGKMTIDLHEQLVTMDDTDWIHCIRIEELYPFPKEAVADIFARFSNVKEIYWVQEEPKNMGAWSFVAPYLQQLAPDGKSVTYVGRKRRSSPAEGDPNVHKR